MRRFFILVLLLVSTSLRAEDFKILFINTESIKIGKNTCFVGDVFGDGDKIFWKDGKQAMKVLSLETKKQYVLVSEDFKQRKMKSVKDFIVKSNRLSTRGIGKLSSVSACVGDRIYWFAPTLIAVDYEPVEAEYFFITYEGRDYRLPFEDGQLVFDSTIWGNQEPRAVEADLLYHYADGENEVVSPGVLIIPLPREIQLRKR